MFQKISFLFVTLVLVTSSLGFFAGSVNVSAENAGLDFTHLADTLPVNNVSDGSVSVCITNVATGAQTALFQVGQGDTSSIDLPTGQYTVLTTSFTRSSLDGRVMDPCSQDVFASPSYWWNYAMEIRDGFRSKFEFAGTGSIVDPRLNPGYATFDPFERINENGTGIIYFNFQDYFVDENGVRHISPLGILNKICMDNGAAGPILMDLIADNFSSYLNTFQNVGLPQGGMRFFPPLVDGTCGTQDIWTTPFTQYIEPVFGANQNYSTRFGSVLQVTGFGANRTFVAVTPDAVVPVEQPVSSSSSSSTSVAPAATATTNLLLTVRTGGGK